VVSLHGKVVSDSALDAEVVLVEVSISQVRILGAKADQAAGWSTRTLLAKVRYQRNPLIIGDRPWELPGLRNTCALIRGEAIGGVQPHVRRDIVKYFVIPYAESGADHGGVLSEHRS